MKKAKMMIVILLLLSLLLSACGHTGSAAVSETEEGSGIQPLAARVDQIQPTRLTTTLFRAKFEGSAVKGSGETVDGVYRFTATETDGEAWHVKLECNYPTVSGRDYRVTYRFHSDVSGKVKFGDFQEFNIVKGDNSVTGMMIASSGTSYLDLQLGMLPPFTIDFSEIEIEEFADEVDYADALSSPVNFEKETTVWEKHDQGYAPVLTRSKDEVSINYVASSWEPGVWKSRLYVKTGLIPEAGIRYRITADVTGDEDMPFELLFNNGDEEKGYGALYGQSLTANVTTRCEAVITGTGDGDELVLQFSLGEAPEESTLKIGNLHVETITDHYTSVLPTGFALDKVYATGKMIDTLVPTSYKDLPLSNFSYTGTDTVYESHFDGYVVDLQESASSATLKISQAPAEGRGVWKVNLCAATGVELEAGTPYRITYDLQSAADQGHYEVCFDGSSEKAYGALYGRSLSAGGTDSVEYFVTPDENGGPLTLRLQLGNTDSTAGNTVTLSNIGVEKMTASRNVWEEHYDSMAQALSASGGSASLKVTEARSGGGLWSSKLFIQTGVTLEAGTSYRVVTTLSSDKPFEDYEVVYDNGDQEAGYAKRTGLSVSGSDTVTTEFTTPASGCGELVLRFQVGNSPADNTITVSNIQVCKISGEPSVVAMPNFAYPVTTDPGTETVPAGFVPQSVSLSAADVAYDEFQQSVSCSGSSASLSISQARPADMGGVWSSRLHVGTGVVLEKDAEYRVTATLHASSAIGEFQLLYSNGFDETDYNPDGKGYQDGRYGLSVGDGGSVTIQQTFTVPARSEYKELVLRFQLGNSPAPNEITVSDVSVEKWVPEHSVEKGGSTEPNSFALETNNGTAGSLSGNGSSATALITTPGDDWHIKLYAKPGVSLEAGKTYQISMNVSGAAGCDVVYKRLGGEEDSFGKEKISSGSQTVTHTVTPDTAGTLEIILKLGTVPANSSVTVSGLEIKDLSAGVGENLMKNSLTLGESTSVLPGFSYNSAGYIRHATDPGYIVDLKQNSSSADFRILQAPAERHPWNVKLHVRTGFTPEKDKGYRVSFDITSAKAQNLFEVFYDGDSEHAYGELYEQSLPAGKKTVSYTIEPNAGKGELSLQIRLGATNGTDGNSYTISNLKLEEVTFKTTTTPETREVTHLFTHDGYYSSLDKSRDRATVRIEKTPSSGMEPWRTKLFVETGITLKAGQKYRVSMDVKSIIPAPFEVCYNDGEEEKGLGAIFGLIAKPSGQYVEYVTYPKKDTQLVIQLSLGNCSAPNSIVLNKVSVEKAGAINLVSDTIYTF